MKEKTYTLFWLTGKSELVKGYGIENAMSGYSAGAIRALDFYGEGDLRDEWCWDGQQRTWKSKEANK